MRYRPFDDQDRNTVIGDAALDAIEADAVRFNDDPEMTRIAEHVMLEVPALVEEIRMYRRWRSQVRTNVIACLGPADQDTDT